MKWPDELIFILNSRMAQKITLVRMDGRVCVLTGATSGVGYRTAKRLAEGGARLVLVCRNAEKAARVKDELECEHQTSVRVLQADFSSLADVRKTAVTILEEYPRIDVLINNAGLHNTR
jgi:short-subunit dehydrogenase